MLYCDSSKKFTKCSGATRKGCCCDSEGDTSCCNTAKPISIKSRLARSLGIGGPGFL